MSFYDSASLAFLPSGGAGKDGKAYSIKPVPEYGNELVTNGGFDSDSDWTLTNFTIANGKANVDSSVAAFLTQTSVATIGKVYRVEFTISDYVEGSIRLRYPFTNGDLEMNPVQNQTYVYYGVATDTRFELQSRFTEDINYKVDNVSVKEVIVDGDFTFSRGSNLTATRVDSNGLIEKGRENLLENSVWDGVTTDTKPTGWNNQFVSGTGTFDVTATEGQIRFQTLDASSRAFIYSPTITTNGIVVASVYVDEVTTALPLSNLLIRSANATDLFAYEDGVEINYSDNVQAGKRYSVVFNKTGSTTFRFGVGASSGILGDLVLSRPQIEVGLVATEWITSPIGSTGKAGILEDSPRFDYSGGASCPSLLLEPSRTNEIRLSEYFADTTNYDLRSADVTTNYAISPEGVQNATKVTPQNATTDFRIQTQFTFGVSGNNVLSVFAKYESGGFQYLVLATNATFQTYAFDIQNGTKVGNAGGGTIADADATIEDYGNGWYRCSIKSNNTGNADGVIYLSDDGTNTTATGDGSKGMLIYGFQGEQLVSYPTSYIPNHSGGSVTRNAENCSGAGNSSTFNDTEGVLYAEIAAIADDQTSKVISLSDGTFDERVLISTHTGGSNQIRVFIKSGGSFSATIDVILNDITDYNKIAYRYKSGETKLFVNGSLISTSTDTFSISGLNALQFASGTSTAVPFYGNAKQVIVFNTALSDTDLEILTGTSYESFAAMATALNYTTYE